MRYVKQIAGMLVSILMLSGCTLLSGGDDLLQTPSPSKSFLLLQKQLDALGGDLVSISPQSGQYRNTVTFEDLNGDGVEEAIATMRKGNGGAIQIYTFELVDDAYQQIGCITGQGTAIGSLSFFSLSEDGKQKGMIVTWTLSNSVEQGMSICTMQGGEMKDLLELEYTDYTTCDLDQDKIDELLVLNYEEKGRKTARYYDYRDEQMLLQSEKDATQEISTVANVVTGKLASGEPAVFVDNKYEQDNGMQTDIYAVGKDGLENLALMADVSTYRPVSLYYSDDMNGDGIIEVPRLVALPGYEEAPQMNVLWQIDWYDFSLKMGREQKRAFTSYLSLNEEWNFLLPEDWRGNVTARANGDSEVGQTTFSDVETGEELLTIYSFAGEDRELASKAGGLVSLGASSNRSYAAKIETASSDFAIKENLVRENFSMIQSDWY